MICNTVLFRSVARVLTSVGCIPESRIQHLLSALNRSVASHFKHVLLAFAQYSLHSLWIQTTVLPCTSLFLCRLWTLKLVSPIIFIIHLYPYLCKAVAVAMCQSFKNYTSQGLKVFTAICLPCATLIGCDNCLIYRQRY